MVSVTSLLRAIADIGRDPARGGHTRPVYSRAEAELREWFLAEAQRRGLETETDRNGLMWAWDGPVTDGALVTGSHLDSVPGGGAYDGPLGVAAALAAVDELRRRSSRPGQGGRRSLAIVVFPEEEGSRFGVACLGSRLLTGGIDADRARGLKDAAGDSFAEISRRHGVNPEHIGADHQALRRIGQFVELHVEQGLALADLERAEISGYGSSAPFAVAGSVLSHGRWKMTVQGQGNHAGTTLMADRADPMVAAARIIIAAQQVALAQPGARVTVGRVQPVPGGTNVIASRVELWLDVRHPHDEVTAAVVTKIHGQAQIAAAGEGCTIQLSQESLSPTTSFDARLSSRLQQLVPGAPLLESGAGHDAGILAGHVPSGMIFVRNPSGVSHAPQETVEDTDADAAALALADVFEGLL